MELKDENEDDKLKLDYMEIRAIALEFSTCHNEEVREKTKPM